ncbi:MAG: HD domain-containing protein [Firmicutes bacterium]|nr:HD domain-containing protein [Bacillota bacterium]
MAKKFESNSYRCLMQILNDKQFQKRFSLSKSATIDLLRKDNWREKCNKLDSYNKDLDCASILSYCAKTLKRFGEEPASGWLQFTYRYAISLSYPEQSYDLGTIKQQDGALFILAVLQSFYQTAHSRGLIDQRFDLYFPDERDIEDSEYSEEYYAAFNYFKKSFVYEMMRLAQEITPYTILEHIAGVHNLAIKIGRQMKEAGTPVDLALLSAASFLHDIGKFGCKEGERVPYLHYYYTDQWCKAVNAPNIGHIAANHSAWDLELENLSVESLLLIYADFRVKQITDEQGKEHTEIYPLSDSFAVILKKLDNVDEAKKYRYLFVYAKLKDFEDYMRSLGVDLADGLGYQPATPTDIALMSPNKCWKHLNLWA